METLNHTVNSWALIGIAELDNGGALSDDRKHKVVCGHHMFRWYSGEGTRPMAVLVNSGCVGQVKEISYGFRCARITMRCHPESNDPHDLCSIIVFHIAANSHQFSESLTEVARLACGRPPGANLTIIGDANSDALKPTSSRFRSFSSLVDSLSLRIPPENGLMTV